MSSDRPNQTLADYVALAISPALVMGLVGSLVFFLLEVCYSRQGEYKDHLRYIFFFFVFGAVLVSRISMTQGIAGRAGLYGLVLAGAAWAGMQVYVQYPKDSTAGSFSWLINLFLVGVVWWCAHRLTWDCTQIDEETVVGGEGLLQATGLETPADGAAKKEPVEEPERDSEKKEPGPLIGWWEKLERYREGRKKRRVLGGWVIYFSLAALPLFGLGEALIPAEETARRQYVFWLAALYVGCGLGLLLTTCFLSIRHYLRQRRLQMPAAMTAVWLTTGGGLIVALLVIGALLPRPRPEYSLLPFQPAGSDKRSASNFAGQGGSSGQGEGRRIGDQPKDKGEPSGDKDSQTTGRDKGETSQEKDKDGSSGEKDKDKDGTAKDKDKAGGSGRDERNESPSDAKDKASNPQQPKSGDEKTARPKDKPTKSDQASSDSRAASHPGSSWDWKSALSGVAAVLKWIVFALLILAVIFFVLREGLKFLANFTDWARHLLNALSGWWANLFKGRAREAREEEEAGTAKRGEPVKPFAAYGNPFLDGRGERWPVKEIVQYTFAALQAWAREQKVERRPGETPLEFAGRLGEEFPGLEADVRRFTILYARAVYDYGPLPANALDVVRQFWKRLETAAEQPMSV